MRDDHLGKNILIILAMVGIIALCATAFVHQTHSDHESIRQFHSARGEQVVEIDKPWFGSPWWFHDDDDRIYRAKVRDKREHERTCWHKFNIWGHDHSWK